MEKAQARGVETLARQTRHGLLIAVHGVPQNRVADIGQMDPDLVGTARLQPAAQVGDAGIPGQHLPMGDGGTSPATTAIFLRSLRLRPMGAFTVPLSCRKLPTAKHS